jgi:hypothetical protein
LGFLLCTVALGVGVVAAFAIPQRRPEAAFAPHQVGDPATAGAAADSAP